MKRTRLQTAGWCVAAAALCAGWYIASSSRASHDRAHWVRRLVDSCETEGSPGEVVTVAVLANESTSYTNTVCALIDSHPSCRSLILTPGDIQRGALRSAQVLLVPGGSGKATAQAVGAEGAKAIRQFVRDGGGYVGICGGAYYGTAGYSWSLGLVDVETVTGVTFVRGFGEVSLSARGGGTVATEFTDSGSAIFATNRTSVSMQYSGGPIFVAREATDSVIPLAFFRDEIFAYEEQRGTMIDTPAILGARFGDGSVLLFSPHPELSVDCESFLVRALLAVRMQRDGATGRKHKAD